MLALSGTLVKKGPRAVTEPPHPHRTMSGGESGECLPSAQAQALVPSEGRPRPCSAGADTAQEGEAPGLRRALQHFPLFVAPRVCSHVLCWEVVRWWLCVVLGGFMCEGGF